LLFPLHPLVVLVHGSASITRLIQLSHLGASRSPLVVRVDPNLVHVEKQAAGQPTRARVRPLRKSPHAPA
jgi:hypothetical protein